MKAADFWSKVDKTDTCWLWTGATTHHATHQYGITVRQRRKIRAHRYSWEIANGPIPAGMLVCHTCDVTLCVRPDHLFLGTHSDNTRDMFAKNRQGGGQPKGSANGFSILTEDAVRTIRQLRASGQSLGSLAAQFAVSKPTIWQIVQGRSWRHVT